MPLPCDSFRCLDGESKCLDGERKCLDGEPKCLDGEPKCFDGEPKCFDGEPKCFDGEPYGHGVFFLGKKVTKVYIGADRAQYSAH